MVAERCAASGYIDAVSEPVHAGVTVDVVIAAYNAAATLDRSLDAAIAAAGSEHVLLVDDGSDDGSAGVARERGLRVERLERRSGPALARNRGAQAASAEVVLFLDADCVAHEDVVERVRAAFATDPALAALSGSYDDSPPERGFFSQYMNLRHHHTHQRARHDDSTFWAGCGAVRRGVFLSAGGFDGARYTTPQIEDIELGLRLRRAGARLRLDPGLQVTHLKRWTLSSILRTDLYDRALPWSELILEDGELPSDLNLRASQRAAAVLAAPALIALAALPVCAATGSWWAGAAAIAIVSASFAANRDLVGFFAARRGVLFALGGWLFHQVHLLIATGAFVFASLRRPRAARRMLRSRV
jgi:GT2 family glycosyltransferase